MRITIDDVKAKHDRHQMGVEHTRFLTNKVDPAVTKVCVNKVVKQFSRCQPTDPTTVKHEVGDLGMGDSWHQRDPLQTGAISDSARLRTAKFCDLGEDALRDSSDHYLRVGTYFFRAGPG